MRTGLALLALCNFAYYCGNAQSTSPSAPDSTVRVIAQLPSHYLSDVQARTQAIDKDVTDQSTRYLGKLSKAEARLLAKLQGVDSNAGAKLPAAGYQGLVTQMQHTTSAVNRYATTYVPGLDTLATTLKFLQGIPAAGALSQLGSVSAQVQQLQGKLNETTLIQQYVSQRQQLLAQLLSRYTHLPPGVAQALVNYKATAYYYQQQIQQYKDMLNDPQKMERLAVTLLSRVPAYTQFMARYSILASLFQLPAGYGGGTATTQGLQTQTQIQQMLQSQMGGSAGAGQVQQQLQSAQSQITNLQNNLSRYGVGGGSLNMPNFQPNAEKTKTFLKRLEYGANIQFTKGSYDFPTTGDLALTLGYKINDKSTVGVGASYNIGLGTGWNFIQFTNQGVGLRSYMDWKIWKTYYVTGGYEMNYMTEFTKIAQLETRSAWQPSALIGVEKKYKISGKMQGNIQVLFDALYKEEIPEGQMIKFRVGYNF